jgi:hypothetical protein
VDVREENSMYSLVIKEKTGIVGGWLEVEGQEHVLPIGDHEDEVDDALQTLFVWRDWMDKEIDSVQEIFSLEGHVLYTGRPCLIESIALVYTRS